jgi:mannose-6-phosphate isomerase-like protein (cupin superfamily)
MKKITFAFMSLIGAVGVFPAVAADHGAVVTEAVNQVTHGPSQSVDSAPAPTGTVLQDGEYLKTGGESLAEMKLPNQTVTRLGSNTIFNYSAASNQVDLQAGTVLFSKPKDGRQLNIKTEAVTAAILGTTGFLHVHHQGSHTSYMFGLIEGKASLTVDGKVFVIHDGELLMFSPGAPPQIIAFNVPLMIKTSPLFTKFGNDLPNESYIAEEIALYEDLLARGFIKPEGKPHFFFDYLQGMNFPTLTFDSAGNQIFQQNNPPPGTPPPTGSSPTGSTEPASPSCPPKICSHPPSCDRDRRRDDDRDKSRDRCDRDDRFAWGNDFDKRDKFDKFNRDDKFARCRNFDRGDKFEKCDKFNRDDKFGRCDKPDNFDRGGKPGPS